MRGQKKSPEREAREVFKPGRHLRRSVYLIPSLFTVGNMFAGFFALISTLNADYEAAAVAIGIAVLLDGVDGWVARLANADSDFGLQLDSLADVISFGIAPAILIYSWGLSEFGNFARFSTFVFLICGAKADGPLRHGLRRTRRPLRPGRGVNPPGRSEDRNQHSLRANGSHRR